MQVRQTGGSLFLLYVCHTHLPGGFELHMDAVLQRVHLVRIAALCHSKFTFIHLSVNLLSFSDFFFLNFNWSINQSLLLWFGNTGSLGPYWLFYWFKLQCAVFCRGLTTCLADIIVQMKIPAETKAIDRYLLAEYLQGEKTRPQTSCWAAML